MHSIRGFPATLHLIILGGIVFCLLPVCVYPAAGLQGAGRNTDADASSNPPTNSSLQNVEKQSAKGTSMPTVDDSYRLSIGDVLIVSVYGEPTMSGKFRVGPGGTIALPMLGQLDVHDMTMREAREFLTDKISTLVRRPAVTIALDQASSARKVYVSGEVSQYGSLTLPFGATLTDAVAAAGPGRYADLARVKIVHPGQEPIRVDCSGLRGEGNLGTNHILQYGDRVFVPRVKKADVAVLGAVSSPQKIELPPGQKFSVLDAIGMAGGLLPGADRAGAILLRDKQQVARINLKQLLEKGDMSQNRQLQGGDVLLVREAEAISVVGNVQSPRIVQSGEPIPILKALAAAGGATPTGDLTKLQIVRDDTTITVNLERFMEKGQRPSELDLQPGDVLLVPTGKSKNALVMGSLARVGSINLQTLDKKTLLRVLTMAGPAQAADLTQVTVYRDDKTIVRNMKAVMEKGELSEDLELKPGDLIVVPHADVPSIVITGAVQNKGTVRLIDDQMRSLGQLVISSGPLPQADLSKVVVTRKEKKLTTNLKDFIQKGDRSASIQLQDGDMVRVPFSTETIMLTGAVRRGGTLTLTDNVPRQLARLVLSAQPTEDANLDRVVVHRNNKDITRNVRAFLQEGDRSEAFTVQAGDMISVPRHQSHNILLTGAVQRPGLVSLTTDEARDLARVVTTASPFAWADLDEVSVIREGKKTTRDIAAYYETGLDVHTLQLQDGDIIIVPGQQNVAFIAGAVNRTGTVSLDDIGHKFLGQLVNVAAPAPFADLTQVTIYRGQERTTYDLSGLREGNQPLGRRIPVKPRDRIIVPSKKRISIVIYGAVGRTGSIQLTRREQQNLANVVTSAGPAARADLSKVMVHRDEKTLTRNIKAYLEKGNNDETLYLHDGDRVFVPIATSEGIMITGHVNSAGKVMIAEGVEHDLLNTVIRAGPVSDVADLTRVSVYRNGKRHVKNLVKLQQEGDRSQNMTLQAGDLVFVPEAKETVIFAGQVNKPGPLNVHRVSQRDLVHLLPMAAPDREAGLDRVKIYRDNETIVRDYRAIIKEGDMSQNIDLKPGDIVYVPPDTTHNVMVLGELKRNGLVNVRKRQNRSLLRIVTVMGPTEAADLTRVTIFHENQKPSYHNLQRLQNEGDLSQNTDVEPGSVIVVPRLDVVYVIGAAKNEGALPLKPDWTLMDVITRVGPGMGVMKNIRLIRKRPDGTPESTRINLRKLRQGKLPQPVQIKPGDVIYIPRYRREDKNLWRTIRDALWTATTIFNLFD